MKRNFLSGTALQKGLLCTLKVLVLFQESNVLIAANSQGTIKVSYLFYTSPFSTQFHF